jgi:cardiolipin synthase
MMRQSDVQGGRKRRPGRIALRAFGGLALVQALVAAVILIAARLRRKGQSQGFPHPTFPEVAAGENRLQLFSFGRDLYEAMLAAIDEAQETIYLETFIWKDDAVGRAFKEHLARKAVAGIAVYVVLDRFGNLLVPRALKAFLPVEALRAFSRADD